MMYDLPVPIRKGPMPRRLLMKNILSGLDRIRDWLDQLSEYDEESREISGELIYHVDEATSIIEDCDVSSEDD